MLNSGHAARFISQMDFIDLSLFIGTVIIVSLIVMGIRRLSDWISKKFPSKRMMVFGWIPVVNFLLYFAGVFGSFYVIFDPNQKFLIAFIISGFVAVGFAVKDLVGSVIGGIVLLIDKPFQVGDRITFQEHYGEIIRIGLRSVKLLTLDESIVTIPNQRFISDTVSSSSAGELGMMTTVDVNVSLDADLYKIKDILHKQAEKSQYVDVRGKIAIVGKEVLGIDGVVSFVMTVKCILKDARLEKPFQTEFLMDVNKELKRNKIKRDS
ncbi:MAG: mechanosensitive ion channel domain-containing protein [Alphaproteobacteria bacterium]